MSYRRGPRMLSQASYRLIQEIHERHDRLTQIERGLGYRPAAQRVTTDGRTSPLHVGPELELLRGHGYDRTA